MQRPGKDYLRMMLSSAVMLTLVIVFYFLFQHEAVYNHTLGRISGNYSHEDEQIVKKKIPYTKFSAADFYSWDAAHYSQIKDHGYNLQSAGGDYIFAFFPLFPILWKFSGLSAVQVSFVNYIFWILSIIVLLNLMSPGVPAHRTRYFIVLLGIPMLFVFLIPYTEGLYMITTTIALWSLYKNRYWVYFASALLSSMTRQVASILTLAIFFTEIYFFWQHHHVVRSIKSFVLKIAPLITGLALVSWIQSFYGSGHIAKFIAVEKYWGFSAAASFNGFTDWAHEQFCTNLPLALIALPAALIFLGYQVWTIIRHNKPGAPIKEKTTEFNREYLYILSIIYITGMAFMILLLKGGSLNGLSRFVFCTPFYSIALFMIRDKSSRFCIKTSAKFYSLAFIAGVLALSITNYSSHWNFSDLGFFLLFLQLAFSVFAKLLEFRWLVFLFVVLTALWTSYLLNMFVSNVWIVT